jgi:cytochrome bd-type quinol oxidase subunit 2
MSAKDDEDVDAGVSAVRRGGSGCVAVSLLASVVAAANMDAKTEGEAVAAAAAVAAGSLIPVAVPSLAAALAVVNMEVNADDRAGSTAVPTSPSVAAAAVKAVVARPRRASDGKRGECWRS